MDRPKHGSPGGAPRSALLHALDVVVKAATSWLALTLAIAVAPGLAVWPLLHLDELRYFVANTLDADLRMDVLRAMAVSATAVLTFYAAAHVWLKSKRRGLTFSTTARGLNRYTFLALALPILTTVMHRGIETGHRLFALTLIALITVFFGVFIYRILEGPSSKPGPSVPSWRHWLLVALICAYYGGYMSYLALLDHRNLGTHIYDLGIYDNIFWNTAFDDLLGCSYCKLENHISSHFDPLIYLLSPIYRLAPNAETILILQSVWLGTGVFPLFLLAQRRLQNPRLAVLLCVIYVFYPALHGVNMYDFHSLTMVVPTLMWVIYFIDARSKIGLWTALAVMLMTREDMPLLVCFLGGYAMLRRRYTTGLTMIVVSLAYLAVVKLLIMPDPGLLMSSKDSMGYAYYFKEMIPHQEEGVRGFVISLLTNPVYALQVFFKENRVFFFLALLQPLLLLPLLAGKKRFVMLYGLLFLGLASRKHVFDLHFQYSSVLFPVLFAGVPDGISRITRSRFVDLFRLDRARVPSTLMWTMLVSTLLVSAKFGAIIPNDHFKAGWNYLSRKLDEERYDTLQELLAQIPDGVEVCSTSSLGPHVSARDKAHKWPSCKGSEYALLISGRFGKKDERRLERLVQRGKVVRVDGGNDIELYRMVPDDEAVPVRPPKKKQRAKTDPKAKTKALRPG